MRVGRAADGVHDRHVPAALCASPLDLPTVDKKHGVPASRSGAAACAAAVPGVQGSADASSPTSANTSSATAGRDTPCILTAAACTAKSIAAVAAAQESALARVCARAYKAPSTGTALNTTATLREASTVCNVAAWGAMGNVRAHAVGVDVVIVAATARKRRARFANPLSHDYSAPSLPVAARLRIQNSSSSICACLATAVGRHLPP